MNKLAYSSIIASAFITSTLCSCETSGETNNVKLVLMKTSEKYKHYNQNGPNNLIIMTTPGHTMSAGSMNSVITVFAKNQKDYYKNIFAIDKQETRDTNKNISIQVNTKKVELEDLQNQELLDNLLEEGFEVLNIASSQGTQVAFDLTSHLDKIFYGAPIHTLSINGCVKGGEILNTFKAVETNPMVQGFGLSLGNFSTNHKGVSDLFPNSCSARVNALNKDNSNLYFVGSTVNSPFDFITRCAGIKLPMLQMATIFVPEVKKVVDFYATKESDGLFTLEEQVLSEFPNAVVKGYVHDAIYTEKEYMNITAKEYTKMRLNSSSKELEKELSGMKLN